MHNQSKAYSLALISIVFWSTMGTAFKLTLNYLNPGMLLLIATFTAFLFLGIVCADLLHDFPHVRALALHRTRLQRRLPGAVARTRVGAAQPSLENGAVV